MKIGEFFVQLGVEADTKTLKDFAKSIGDIPLNVGTAILALAGIEYELGKVTEQAIQAAIGFQMFGAQTGLSWQELQRWQIVAERANVSAESVTSSITSLESHLAQIRMGYGNTRPFAMFGIDINQNAFGVLSQLRKAITHYPRSVSRNLLGEMGIGPDMMRILELSDREWLQYVNHVHGMTENQMKDFLELKNVFVSVSQSVRFHLIDLVDHFVELFEKGMQFKHFLLGLGVVAGILAVAFAPLTAALVALVLVLDDLAVYMNGGKSVIGYFLDTLKGIMPGAGKGSLLGAASMLGVAGPTGMMASALMNNVFNMSVHGIVNAEAFANKVMSEIKRQIGAAEAELSNKAH